MEHQVYGSAQLEGYILSDVVCLDALVAPKEEPGKKKPKDEAQ